MATQQPESKRRTMVTNCEMSTQEFVTLCGDTWDDITRLTQSKGHEYANSDNQLDNFRRLSKALGLAPDAVCFVYLTKHMDAIQNHIREPERAKSEPITGRIDDAILYLLLLKAIYSCQSPRKTTTTQQ
jgi:hypothetical protein|tara:strand:- start:92 stop:478 length:387 start_codon:yes stop_codon:yes gene_type:complete